MKVSNFHVANRSFPPKFIANERCSRSHVPIFIMAGKKWFIVLIGPFYPRERKSHYFGMDDERPAAVNLIRKPFLIRFRNRKYPFLFQSECEWAGAWGQKTKSAEFPKYQYILLKAVAILSPDNKFHDLKALLRFAKFTSLGRRLVSAERSQRV